MAHNKTELYTFIQFFVKYLWHVRYITFSLLALVIIGSILLSRFEGLSIIDSIYLAFVTAFTIGYGDISPITVLGKVVCISIGLIGIIFTGLVIAVSTRALFSAVQDETNKD